MRPRKRTIEASLAIFQRADYARGSRSPFPECVWRLSRAEGLLSQLDDPHRANHSVHIAGAKGKGSTTAMIEAVLLALEGEVLFGVQAPLEAMLHQRAPAFSIEEMQRILSMISADGRRPSTWRFCAP